MTAINASLIKSFSQNFLDKLGYGGQLSITIREEPKKVIIIIRKTGGVSYDKKKLS
jgi:protein-L-isoaspartate O-methyltransferase